VGNLPVIWGILNESFDGGAWYFHIDDFMAKMGMDKNYYCNVNFI
jgi:hypothetical protein